LRSEKEASKYEGNHDEDTSPKGGPVFMKVFTLVAALALICALSPGDADAYMINGLLDDWGVQPHVQWMPSAGISWVEEDNWGSAHPSFPSGGELYDVEAMYGHVTGGLAYVALVTSFPRDGIYSAMPGDFGIDLNMDGIYEYGLKTTGAQAGGLFADPIWANTTTHLLSSPAHMIGGTLIDLQPLAYHQTSIIENGSPTWVIEGCFDWSAVGDPTTPFGLHWTMDCGNDVLDLQVNPVPEPATLLLLAPGLAALWGFSRRRKRSC
jgi:hypothetical protein